MDIYDSDSFATSWQACSPQQEQCRKKPRKRRKKDGKSGAKNTDRYDKNSAKDSDRSVKNNDQGTLEYSDASTTATSDSQYFTGQWTRKEREILNTLVENEERQKNEARQTFKNLLCYRNSEEGDRSEDANSWFKRYVSKLFQPPSSPDKRATDQQDIMYSVASFEV